VCGLSARVAAAQDLDAISVCLTSAFLEDPVWGLWSFPDPSGRAQGTARLMRFWAGAGIRSGGVWMTERAEAAAVWIPPGVAELTPAEEEAFGPLLAEVFGERAAEASDLFEQFEQHHPSEEPHFYLSLWGTHGDHRGHGIGTALLRSTLAKIDDEGMPAYLESTNPANLPRYEALGFRPRSSFGPPGGPVITTMWRAAR